MSRKLQLGVEKSLLYNQNPRAGSEGTNSASLAKAERTILKLEEENANLRKEVADIKSLYAQLVTEGDHEQYDERRVNLLKSQLIQMERQVLLLSEAQSSRVSVIMEVENNLAAMADLCRDHLMQAQATNKVSMSRSDVNKLVETAESARIKLYKNLENTSLQSLSQPLLMMDKFTRCRDNQPVTMLDVCSGQLKHLNLKHVGKLESQLVQLYKQLKLLSQSLLSISTSSMNKGSKQDAPSAMNNEVPTSLSVRVTNLVLKACSLLETATHDLLALSLLVPSAPLPSLRKPILKEMTVDNIVAYLPPFPKSRQSEGRAAIEALLKAMNYTVNMAKLEAGALKEEVSFHQAVYDLQQQYVEGLLSALIESYQTFEESACEMLCSPLKVVLKDYKQLQNTAAETELRTFLSTFKAQAHKLEATVDQLSKHDEMKNKESREALSEFGQHFLQSIQAVQAKHRQKRDDLVSQLEQVQQDAKDHVEELRLALRHCKIEELDPKQQYEAIVNSPSCSSADSSPEKQPSSFSVTQEKNMVNRRDVISVKQTESNANQGMATSGSSEITGNDKNQTDSENSVSDQSSNIFEFSTPREQISVSSRDGTEFVAMQSMSRDSFVDHKGSLKPADNITIASSGRYNELILDDSATCSCGVDEENSGTELNLTEKSSQFGTESYRSIDSASPASSVASDQSTPASLKPLRHRRRGPNSSRRNSGAPLTPSSLPTLKLRSTGLDKLTLKPKTSPITQVEPSTGSNKLQPGLVKLKPLSGIQNSSEMQTGAADFDGSSRVAVTRTIDNQDDSDDIGM